MLKKRFVATVVLAMLLFIGAYQECMAQTFKDCQGNALMPVDESTSTQDKPFSTFINQVKDAVKNRNGEFIKGILAPEIVMTYHIDGNRQISEGTAQKRKNFLDRWNLSSKDDPFWKIMETILSMGGAFKDQKTYEAPYIHAKWPQDCLRYKYAAIVDKNIEIRKQPDSTSKIIATLSHVIVEADYPNSPDNWVKIIIPHGPEKGNPGYVGEKFVRSYYDYSVRFVKQADGQWRITFFAEMPKQDKAYPPCRP